jgi:hypothetical protein
MLGSVHFKMVGKPRFVWEGEEQKEEEEEEEE